MMQRNSNGWVKVLLPLSVLVFAATGCSDGDSNGSPTEAQIEAAERFFDSDGDAVTNAVDICPNTMANAAVDEDGCSAAQLGFWVPGEFAPSWLFEATCVSPRSGINPATEVPYEDRRGTYLDENNWLRSWSDELYLWYDEIIDRDPAAFTTPQYFALLRTEALTPSGNAKDRFHFAMATEEWHALSQSGVQAGYGAYFAVIRESPPRQIVVAYTEPDTPATTDPANLARGAVLLEVDGVDVTAGEDLVTLNGGLWPSGPGESHDFIVLDLGSSAPRSFTMVSEDLALAPVRHVGTIGTASGTVGYLLFNDHIASAEQLLIDAVDQLYDAGIDDLVLDLRYNGGGFLAIASELAYMVAGPVQTAGKTFEGIEFNDKHTILNPVTGNLLAPLPFFDTAGGFSTPLGEALPSLDLDRIYILAGPDTCSASESIINSLRGIDVDVIQIGSTTCGKPYGFYPTDNCGTTYFTIQFRGVNDKGFGNYADGFSPANTSPTEGTPVPGCSVADDFTHDLGDPEESRLAAALTYRVDGTCPEPSGISVQEIHDDMTGLSAADGRVYKSPWLQNRIMNGHGR